MHVIREIWFNYEWPSDVGNGPESITELLIGAFIGSFFVPRVRKWWARHINGLKDHFTDEAKALHEKIDGVVEGHDALRRRLDHIIDHHPDIPPLEDHDS
jgi:hypothetical protein